MGAYGQKKRLTEPQTVLVEVIDYTDHSEDTGSVWENRDSTMKDWLEHLQNVFNYHKINAIWFDGNSSEFDIDDVKEVFGNKSTVNVGRTGCFAFNRSILQNFFPIEKLSIMAESFQDSKIPPNLLMQNRFTLTIRENSFPTNITLNDLLLINTSPSLLELGFYREPDMYWGMGAHGRKKKLIAPQSVKVNEYGPIVSEYSSSTLEKNELTMQYWLKHLQDIFNYHKIDFIGFAFNSSQFDINDIKEVFGTATRLMIGNTGCHVFNQVILERFSPIEQLNIKTSNFPNSKVPERILMQNFEDLEIGDGWLETTILSLDQQVLINSKSISMDSLRMPAKELNKFIKLWQRGSNPRMEFLAVVYAIANQGDKEVMLKDIKHEIIPANRLRKFKATGNRMPEEIEGGIDIVRVDGVKATIRFKNRYPSPALELFVWFDHCTVES
ncbi:hypothetical protein CAEBREN_17122 [Caenorhabditis brenneri]|uniref:Sdz-33 F-box domain-containing protein n=1 Tax=Caenorhabditis brenneri TaxID=135651 RepID=G0N0H4_CAEBE|nr:hypothetical protein CAEBREN_17122 [Caenorhabditis brenneri]